MSSFLVPGKAHRQWLICREDRDRPHKAVEQQTHVQVVV